MSSDTSTSQLSYKQESSFGVLPASPAFSKLRFTGESLTHAKSTIQSNEIRSDRQVGDLVKVGASASGGVNFEFSMMEYLDFLVAVMGQTTFTDGSFSGDMEIDGQTLIVDATIPDGFPASGYVSITGASNPANNGIKRMLSRSGDTITFEPGSFVADMATQSLSVGRSYLTNGTAMSSFCFERAIAIDSGTAFQSYSGMTPSGLSLRVASMEAVTGSFTFLGKVGALSSRTLSRAGETAATGTLTLTGNPSSGQSVTLGVGSGQKVYTFQNTINSGSGANQVLVGASASESLDNLIAAIMRGTGSGTLYGPPTAAHTQVTAAAGAGDTMVLTASLTEQTGSFGNTIVTTETLTQGSFGGGVLTGGADATAHLASTTNPVINGSNNVASIASGGGAFSDPVKSLAFSINNNLRAKDKIGEEGAFEIGQGQFVVTGTIEAYFESNELYRQIVDHDDVSMAILLEDSDGVTMGITFPRVKLAEGTPNVGANNADVMMTVNFTAIADPVTGKTMIVDAFE